MKTKKISVKEETLREIVRYCVKNVLSEANVIGGWETSRTPVKTDNLTFNDAYRDYYNEDSYEYNHVPDFVYNWAERLENNLNVALGKIYPGFGKENGFKVTAHIDKDTDMDVVTHRIIFDVFCPMASHKTRHNRVRMLVNKYAYLMFGAVHDMKLNVNNGNDGNMVVELISVNYSKKKSRFDKETGSDISRYGAAKNIKNKSKKYDVNKKK